jgi:hypothetical protein
LKKSQGKKKENETKEKGSNYKKLNGGDRERQVSMARSWNPNPLDYFTL